MTLCEPDPAEARQHVESARVEPLSEGVVEQIRREEEQPRVVQVIETIPLQRTQVVGVAELAPELLEDGPVVVCSVAAALPLEVRPVVHQHGVVVEACVVHVEEEHDVFSP
ncbi:MAG: hypothetical protein ACSLFE_03425 [Gemmatimonadaceae bacterium]